MTDHRTTDRGPTDHGGDEPDVPRDPFVTDAGAYVLGALSQEDRIAFEAHLPTCASCRADVADVASLPALLDGVPRDLVEALDPTAVDPAGPSASSSAGTPSTTPLSPGGWWGTGRVDAPPGMLADLLRVVRHEERAAARRRTLVGALAAAAVVVVTLLVSGVPLPGRTPPAAPVTAADAVVMAPLGDAPVEATVRLEEVAWGTSIDLSCRYDAPGGGPYAGAAPTYSLVVGDAAGNTEEVATWSAVPGKDLTVPASTVMLRDDIVLVEMRAADGTAVLRART